MDNRMMREALRHRFVSMKLDRYASGIEEISFQLFELCADLVEQDGLLLTPLSILAKAKVIDLYGEEQGLSASSSYVKKIAGLRHDPRIDSSDTGETHNSITGIMGRRLGVPTDDMFEKKIDPMVAYRKMEKKVAIKRGKKTKEDYEDDIDMDAYMSFE